MDFILGSNYNLGIDLEENSFDEIERQELEDHLCEIPDTFHRRQRRVSDAQIIFARKALQVQAVIG